MARESPRSEVTSPPVPLGTAVLPGPGHQRRGDRTALECGGHHHRRDRARRAHKPRSHGHVDHPHRPDVERARLRRRCRRHRLRNRSLGRRAVGLDRPGDVDDGPLRRPSHARNHPPLSRPGGQRRRGGPAVGSRECHHRRPEGTSQRAQPEHPALRSGRDDGKHGAGDHRPSRGRGDERRTGTANQPGRLLLPGGGRGSGRARPCAGFPPVCRCRRLLQRRITSRIHLLCRRPAPRQRSRGRTPRERPGTGRNRGPRRVRNPTRRPRRPRRPGSPAVARWNLLPDAAGHGRRRCSAGNRDFAHHGVGRGRLPRARWSCRPRRHGLGPATS